MYADDIVITVRVDFGFFVHWAGVPREHCIRSIRAWNHPTPGAVTFITLPWSRDRDELVEDDAFLKWTITVVRPHPADPSKSLVAVLGLNNVGSLPTWILKS